MPVTAIWVTAPLFPIKNLWRTLLAAGVLLAAAGPVAAETYTVTIQDLDIGVVASGATGDTVFRVDPGTNAITTVSGSGTRVGSSGAGRAVVTVACAAAAPGECNKQVNVKIAVAGSPTLRIRSISRLLFAMGTAVLGGSPIGQPQGSFTIQAVGPNASKTFFIGADLTIGGDDSGLGTGNATSGFSVFVAPVPATPTQGAIGQGKAKVLRSITLTKTADLVFGRVTLPPSGSGTVTIDATTGVRSTTGGVFSLGSPTPGRATFDVGGEGGQVFSITVPATFQMTGTATPLTVTTTNSAGGTGVLSASLGSAGTFVLGVGGSFTLASSSPTGNYTGSFLVTVAYN